MHSVASEAVAVRTSFTYGREGYAEMLSYPLPIRKPPSKGSVLEMCGWESKKQINRLLAATGEPRQLMVTGKGYFYTENTLCSLLRWIE